MESEEEYSNAESLHSGNSNSLSHRDDIGMTPNVRRSASGVLRCGGSGGGASGGGGGDNGNLSDEIMHPHFRSDFESDSPFHDEADPFSG